MQEDFKGLTELYDTILSAFSDSERGNVKFYEWIDSQSADFMPGQLCCAVISFFKRKRWFLREHCYDSTCEENSTWYANQLVSRLPENEESGFVKKYFDLEKGESLITNHCKTRTVILLNKNINDWWNPSVSTGKVESWTCLPIFSYKPRHIQSFVLNDQKLNTNRFYIPMVYKKSPGINLESAAIYESIQTIQKENIKPIKCFNDEKKMSMPFKISKFALELVLYHNYYTTNRFPFLREVESEYILFKEMVNDYFNSISM